MLFLHVPEVSDPDFAKVLLGLDFRENSTCGIADLGEMVTLGHSRDWRRQVVHRRNHDTRLQALLWFSFAVARKIFVKALLTRKQAIEVLDEDHLHSVRWSRQKQKVFGSEGMMSVSS